ncbi:IbrB-like domain-containing protein [Deinococcus knuensis]|uniref:ParB-like N-terminal domain-containing protein n=1 Tax=Deinococcus knuensis TaxID=1837380 RepID=A0ABQ2SRY6_9DEIO|nr:ParB/RepB/Spo0J family partition protein [Deinococcus knuensis]GGS37969.1 hypothetical protein GCM10008961_31870 [Deinococcus knuensis]
MKHGRDQQPLARIEWVPREDLHANLYNPNHVAKPELELLKVSILEDGWTQPIVARPDGEVVDGFHRWTVSADPRIYAMTGGLVPVVRLHPPAHGDQMLSTIRHNRARGEHGVLPMAAIVRRLRDEEGLTVEQVMQRCGMEREEVVRLYERGGMTERGTQGREGFSRGWTPTR